MKKGTYVTLQSWMVDKLNLKGNELLIFGIIYGFSQDEDSEFNGSLTYLAEWTKSTKFGVSKALKKLLEKELIIKLEVYVNNIKYCKYKVNHKKLVSMQLSCMGVCNKVEGGMQQSCINNIEDNTYSNINYSNIGKNKKFVIPTVEEIEKYCKERNNNVDAEVFYDFYESKGWLVGKAPMKDWKAAVRTWERNRTGNTSPKPQKESKPYYECVNPNVDYSQDNSKDLFGDWA